MLERKELLQAILDTYSIPGIVLSEDVFSKTTAFEVNLPPGCDEHILRNYSKEIALHLGVDSISVATTPRDGVFCVEVRNDGSGFVRVGDIFRSLEFIESDSYLSIALGKADSGGSIICDLIKAPHLLVGGDSCTGIAVFLDSVIMSVLRKSTPGDVRMLLADLQPCGLSKYDGTPHMACQTVTGAREAVGALLHVYSELDSRIESLSQGAEMPRLLVIVNEFTCLMTQAKLYLTEIIKAIGRKGKSAHIHLVLTTQATDHSVVTELLKDSIPARVVFRVTDEEHSRLFLDRTGAEALGEGDMLYSQSYAAKPLRLKSAYVSSPEISRVVSFLTANNSKPAYDEMLSLMIRTASRARSPDAVYERIRQDLPSFALPDISALPPDDEDFKDDEDLLRKREERKKDWEIDW